jgi:large subunit ribosomal protein L19
MSAHPLIKAIEATFHRSGLPDFRSGDSVRVHTLIKEGDKERVQVFEGVVIDRRRGGARASFTVRKISYGVGVERIFPLHTSRIEKVEIVQKGRVRRARLNYLRALQGRAARIKGERQVVEKEVAATPAAAPVPPPAPEPPAQPKTEGTA